MKFERLIDSNTAEAPVKFQSDRETLNANLKCIIASWIVTLTEGPIRYRLAAMGRALGNRLKVSTVQQPSNHYEILYGTRQCRFHSPYEISVLIWNQCQFIAHREIVSAAWGQQSPKSRVKPPFCGTSHFPTASKQVRYAFDIYIYIYIVFSHLLFFSWYSMASSESFAEMYDDYSCLVYIASWWRIDPILSSRSYIPWNKPKKLFCLVWFIPNVHFANLWYVTLFLFVLGQSHVCPVQRSNPESRI